jgi:hypothetical protein
MRMSSFKFIKHIAAVPRTRIGSITMAGAWASQPACRCLRCTRLAAPPPNPRISRAEDFGARKIVLTGSVRLRSRPRRPHTVAMLMTSHRRR